jgi:hypothetical protein
MRTLAPGPSMKFVILSEAKDPLAAKWGRKPSSFLAMRRPHEKA